MSEDIEMQRFHVGRDGVKTINEFIDRLMAARENTFNVHIYTAIIVADVVTSIKALYVDGINQSDQAARDAAGVLCQKINVLIPLLGCGIAKLMSEHRELIHITKHPGAGETALYYINTIRSLQKTITMSAMGLIMSDRKTFGAIIPKDDFQMHFLLDPYFNYMEFSSDESDPEQDKKVASRLVRFIDSLKSLGESLNNHQ